MIKGHIQYTSGVWDEIIDYIRPDEDTLIVMCKDGDVYKWERDHKEHRVSVSKVFRNLLESREVWFVSSITICDNLGARHTFVADYHRNEELKHVNAIHEAENRLVKRALNSVWGKLASNYTDTDSIRDVASLYPRTLINHNSSAWEYMKKDCLLMKNFVIPEIKIKDEKPSFEIKEVIFNDPATIVFWKDGTKTVVKAEGEEFDREKGLAMAISKKVLGNKGSYYDTFNKWIGKDDKKKRKYPDISKSDKE